MTQIVVIGEAMVEMAPCEGVGIYKIGFAGDTMNTAWYLKKLLPKADRVDFMTSVGTDIVSNQMVSFLDSSGIGTSRILRHPKLSVGLYMIQLDNGERSFNYWRGESAARTLANSTSNLSRGLKGADIVYFSGITLAILPESDRRRLIDALRNFRTLGGKVVFDPNLRPQLWESTGIMISAVTEAAAVSNIVLPSYEDEAVWFGDANPADTAERYQRGGAETVIVKNGSGPISAWNTGELSHYEAFSVSQVVDTTAAGDSFNAGFLASHMTAAPLELSINAGARLASQVIQSRGALVSVKFLQP